MSLVTLFLFSLSSIAHSLDIPLVKTTSGTLQGIAQHKDVLAYLGIPYAQPPMGALRFAPPQPLVAANSSQVLDSYRSSPGCFQFTYETAFADRSTGYAESEDMLSINIWKPTHKNSSEGLPVMIFLHGGGFTSGANGMPQYSGLEFVKRERDVIFASVNYRVNLFGFPNSPALEDKNLGLLDQRLAVEWLRDNIAAFGGDPKRMVLAGHSAGSISIAYWSFTYAAEPIVKGLFEMSGQPGLIPTDDGTSWTSLANKTECANEDKTAELECMRGIPARTLKKAMSAINFLAFTDPVIGGGAPIIDNTTVFSLEGYAARRAAGNFSRIPLLVSHTTHEADAVLPFSPTIGVNTTLSSLFTMASFQCPVSAIANATASTGVPTWRYLYNGTFPEVLPYDWMRAFHGSDLQLLLGQVEGAAYEEVGEAVRELGGYMMDAVAAFVRDPEAGLEAFGWPRYEVGKESLVVLGGESKAGAEFVEPGAFDAAACEYL
ncbi:alpha/beta-hydrolase [Polyplosphaeria fusca]|uniref:Carboxylic ester hydrolase n=1 Tax=Polyplosphaeria fusca TaxID=682080 RepID=A0A9P4V3X9_9PLEO|nr:alpha/beta-hydrolase [Polyplosphaeria fusca]